MSKKSKKHNPAIPHDEAMVELLKRKPEFAAEYLKAALEDADDDAGQHALLGIIRQIAQAQGIQKVAKAAGIPRESLSRALSPRGNPRLTTLMAVMHAMDIKLTVQTPA